MRVAREQQGVSRPMYIPYYLHLPYSHNTLFIWCLFPIWPFGGMPWCSYFSSLNETIRSSTNWNLQMIHSFAERTPLGVSICFLVPLVTYSECMFIPCIVCAPLWTIYFRKALLLIVEIKPTMDGFWIWFWNSVFIHGRMLLWYCCEIWFYLFHILMLCLLFVWFVLFLTSVFAGTMAAWPTYIELIRATYEANLIELILHISFCVLLFNVPSPLLSFLLC